MEYTKEQLDALLGVEPRGFLDKAEDAASGFVKSFQEPLYGALDWADIDNDSLSVLNKSKRAASLKSMTDNASRSGYGKAGEIVGDISKFALPASMAARLGAGGVGIVGAETLGSAGIGAAEAEEGERLKGAVTEGGMALGGGLIGGGLVKAMKGLNRKKGVDEFIDSGGYLTPGQQAESKALSGAESVASVMPFSARAVNDFRDIASDSVSPTFINKVAKKMGADKLLSGGQEGITQLKGIVNDSYAKAWDSVDSTLWASKRKAFGSAITKEADFWPADQAAALERLRRSIDKPLKLKRIDKKLRDMIGSASNDYDFQQQLKTIQEKLRQSAGVDADSALKEIDKNYGDFLTVQDAAAKSRGGMFDAKALETSSRKVGGVDRASRGAAPLQGQAEDVAEAMKDLGGEPLDMLRRLSKWLPTPLPRSAMKGLGDALMGQTNPQRAMKSYFDANPQHAQEIIIAMSALNRQSEQE